MNVKQWISNPTTSNFKQRDLRKHSDFRGGFETIPDVVIFSPGIMGDWRRRRFEATLQNMLVAIEIKASERRDKRLTRGEIVEDVEKLAAHREEVRILGGDMYPVMMIIDVAECESERMRESALSACRKTAQDNAVSFMYVSPNDSFQVSPGGIFTAERASPVLIS